ncbi:hypothetical protein JCM5350_004791 [Sporobolomyces pararoseus]
MPRRLLDRLKPFKPFQPFQRRNGPANVLNRTSSQVSQSTATLVSIPSSVLSSLNHEKLQQRFEAEMKEGNLRKKEFLEMLNKVHSRFEGEKLQEKFKKWIREFLSEVAVKTQAFEGFNYCYEPNYNRISNAIFVEFSLNHFIHLPNAKVRKFNPRRVKDVVASCHFETPKQVLERNLKRFPRLEMKDPKAFQVVVDWLEDLTEALESKYGRSLYTGLKVWLRVEIVLNAIFETHSRMVDDEMTIVPTLTVKNVMNMLQF